MELQAAIEMIRCDELQMPGATTWADLGSGSGLFTDALSRFLQKDSKIYAVDKETTSVGNQTSSNGVIIQPIKLNFISGEFNFNNLDGVLMANSIHYVRDKKKFPEKII